MPARKYFDAAGPGGFTRRIRIPIYKTTFRKIAEMGYIRFSECTQGLNRRYGVITRPEINDAWIYVLDEKMNVELAGGSALTEDQMRRLKLAGDQQFGRGVASYWETKARRNPDFPDEYFEVAPYQDPIILRLLNEGRSNLKKEKVLAKEEDGLTEEEVSEEEDGMTEEQVLDFDSDFGNVERLIHHANMLGWTNEGTI